MMKSASRASVSRIGEPKKVISSKSASKRAVDSSDILANTVRTKSLTPQDFDHFVPWIVKELNGSKLVVVKRSLQADREKKRVRFGQSQKGSVNFSTARVDSSGAAGKDFVTTDYDNEVGDAIKLTAIYDNSGRLTEIALIDCSLPINRQLIKIISLCLPFHALLTKLTIKERSLNCGILYEIAKLLPFSNLTNICLDSSYVRQGNYYILLDQTTPLKCLSLSNCNISDVVCREIAKRIECHQPASKNLLLLNLSFNRITDVGAEALGRSLRTNRRLLHLNLCNNKLSDVGADHILVHLSKFQLTTSEVLDMKRQGNEYFEKKASVLDRCLKQMHHTRSKTATSGQASHKQYLAKRQTITGELKGASDYEYAEMMASEIVGSFEYAFTSENTFVKDDNRFCVGNLNLCSLNLGYNNLNFFTITKILDILSYQRLLEKNEGTGLMRLVIEGNNLPEYCVEYNMINKYLKIVTDDCMVHAPTGSRKGTVDSSSTLKMVSKSVSAQSMKHGQIA